MATMRTDHAPPPGDAGRWLHTDANGHATQINDNTAAIAANNSALAGKADDSAVVHNSGAESIAGVKTFAASPIVPTPTTSGQAATKGYADSVGGGGGGYVDPLTTKGDIVVRTASATVRLPVGSNGQVITADSAQTPGIKWATPTGGGGAASPTRVIGAGFRPLQGVTASAVNIGAVTTGYVPVTGGTAIGWGSASGKWRWIGFTPSAWAADSGVSCVNDILGFAASNVFSPVELEFHSDFTELRLHFWSLSKGDVSIIVDDQRISLNTYIHPNPGGDNFINLPITQSAGMRRWRICLHSTAFRGISVNSGAKVVPTMQSAQQWAWFGDSWLHGGILTNNAVSPGVAGAITAGCFRGAFEQHTGIEIWNLAVSSTGYVNHGVIGSPNGTYGSTHRLGRLALLPAMDAIMFFGTANDSGNSGATVVAAAQAAWAAVKTARPDTPIIVVGLEHLGGTEAWGDLGTINTALKTAAEADANVTAFIDLREATHQFFTGTGKDGSPSGSGNRDLAICSDGIHQTHFGYDKVSAPHLARLLAPIPILADITGGSY